MDFFMKVFKPGRLEIRLDKTTQAWLQNFSAQTGKSQGAILREGLTYIQAVAEFISPKQNPKNQGS
jgi:predicted DNA-binding protein